MPVTIPGVVRQLERRFASLATPGSALERAFLGTVREELKPEIRKMYQDSADPFGSAWTRDKDGRPAYQSKKMANAVGLKRVEGGLSVRQWVKWIAAADEGHTFPARQAKAGNVFTTTAGKFISARDAGRLYGKRTIAVTDGNGARFYRNRLDKATGSRFAELVAKGRAFDAHTVGSRRLPPRRQQPGGRMPEGWGEAINRGSDKAMQRFLAKATGDAGPA
jgi:hypothetical protein